MADREEDDEEEQEEEDDYEDGPLVVRMIVRGRRSVKNYCSRESWLKRLPFLAWIPQYSLGLLPADIFGGIVVALTEIPQALAFAAIARLPYAYGLYSCLLSSFVYAFLGTSKDVSLGPTALMALLTASFHFNGDLDGSIYIAVLLTFCVGVLQILLGITRLGAISSFISIAVSVGFLSAVMVVIVIDQIKYILGLHFYASTPIQEITSIIAHIGDINIWDLIIGVISLIVLLALLNISYRIQKRDRAVVTENPEEGEVTKMDKASEAVKICCWPFLWFLGVARVPLVVTIWIIVSFILSTQGYGDAISTVANITGGLPSIAVPQLTHWDDYRTLSYGIIVVSLLSFMEDYSIAKIYGKKNSYVVDGPQELIAVGFSNLAGSFVSAFPVTASYSRSTINSQSGTQTPLSSIVTGFVILIALLFLFPALELIPTACLAAVVITAIIPTVRVRAIYRMWTVNRIDLIPAITTFVCSLFINLVFGIIIGIAVDLVLLLIPIARPRLTLNIAYSGQNAANASNPFAAPAYVIQIEGAIKYPAGDFLRDHLNDISASDEYSRPVILDFCHVSRLDITAIECLALALEDFRTAGSHLVFANLQPKVYLQLERANLPHMILTDSIEDAMDHILSDL